MTPTERQAHLQTLINEAKCTSAWNQNSKHTENEGNAQTQAWMMVVQHKGMNRELKYK